MKPFPRRDGYVDGVVTGRERADPPVVVPAGRVVQEVQVDDQGLAGGAEVGALGRVEQVAAATVAAAAGRRVPDRQEESAAVLVEPPQRQPPADRGRQRDPAGLFEAGDAVRAGVDLEPPRPRSR